MNRLGGWARIGVVLSVLWSGFAVIPAVQMLNLPHDYLWRKSIDRCTGWRSYEVQDDVCAAAREEYAEALKNNKWLAVVVFACCLLLIPFAWLFVLGSVWVVRWTWRGFAGERP